MQKWWLFKRTWRHYKKCDDIEIQFGLDKCAKGIFKKGFLGKSKNTTTVINVEITELEHKRTYKYLEINAVNSIFIL